MNPEKLSRLLELIHRAPLDPELWPSAISAISDAFDSHISGLVVRETANGTFPFVALDPRSPIPVFDLYRDYYGAIDVIAEEVQRRGEGEVVTEAMILANEQIRRTEVWNDFYLKWRFDHQIGGFAIKDDVLAGSLVIYRDASHAEFSADDVRMMELILPHVSTAVRCWFRLRDAEHSGAVGMNALAALGTAVFLTDRSGGLVWANDAGSALLARRDGISEERGALRAAGAETTNILRGMIRAACSGEVSGRSHLAMPRPSGGPPLVLLVTAVSPDAFERSDASCMILINAPADSGSMLAHLQRSYGLTASECALALALGEGKSLTEFAAERRVMLATVRAQLKQIFQKTGTHRQAEVVRLVLGGPSPTMR